MPFVYGQVAGLVQPVDESLPRLVHYRILARLDARHVDTDRARDRDSEVGAAARDVRGPRARDQRLGGNAADVDARAAVELALDDRGFSARAREANCERRTGLSGTDHDRVEFFGHADLPIRVGVRSDLRAVRVLVP